MLIIFFFKSVCGVTFIWHPQKLNRWKIHKLSKYLEIRNTPDVFRTDDSSGSDQDSRVCVFVSSTYSDVCVGHREQGRWFVRVWNRITGSIYRLWLMDYLTLSVNPFLNTTGVYKKQRLHNIYRLILLRTSLRTNIVQLHAPGSRKPFK